MWCHLASFKGNSGVAPSVLGNREMVTALSLKTSSLAFLQKSKKWNEYNFIFKDTFILHNGFINTFKRVILIESFPNPTADSVFL